MHALPNSIAPWCPWSLLVAVSMDRASACHVCVCSQPDMPGSFCKPLALRACARPAHLIHVTCSAPPPSSLCRRVSLGFVVALDYSNPYMSPYQEFQNFKRHPLVQQHIKGGTCLQYGARTLNEGEQVTGFLARQSRVWKHLMGGKGGTLTAPACLHLCAYHRKASICFMNP